MSDDEAAQRLQEYSEEGWRAAYAAAQAAKRLQDRLSTPIDIYSQPVADDIAQLLAERATLHARIKDALANVWVVNIVQRIAPTEFSAVFASSEEAQAFIQQSRLNGTWERDGWIRVQSVKANTADAVVAYLTSAPDDEATT